MADIVDTETRSRMMSGIRGKNTRPEVTLRKGLHARGFRYRLHPKTMIGRPDLVLPKYRVAVFVHGCFWHRHQGCRFTSTPATRTEFWLAKFATNIRRDQTVIKELSESGWRIATVWECAIKKQTRAGRSIDLLSDWIISDGAYFEIGEEDSDLRTACKEL